MYRVVFPILLFGLPLSAVAENLVLNDLKPKNAVQLTADDLRQLMPGAKVAHHNEIGSLRRWINEPDGKFIASSDLGREPGKIGVHGTVKAAKALGTSVTMQPTASLSNGANDPRTGAGISSKAGDKYYGVKSLDDIGRTASEFEFSK
ncbi:MAG: hypothetical protein IPL03_16450 [Sterolibacteriaceae bacterium]|nr:hypothetical protein [Candidatus Methylophosphatis haderslevensis]